MACSYDSMAWYEIHISSSTSCSFVNILVLHQAGARDKLAVTGTSSSSKKTISPTSSTLGWKIRNIQPNGGHRTVHSQLNHMNPELSRILAKIAIQAPTDQSN
ncbi:hypothetical protein F2Q70_00029935 [Brassica cretica]|uniref:Uncharacterized protein n=2 Tax=Brassica cretica TaxID=69181 RepID=A0A8S9FSQ6_BRACR|nr:hypothetical protein F2Q70_00029935 [Brassica cretica]KAF2550844.1 hypothetical protein F2Q68_00034406 [Brassica cretica]KAF3490443.1 hypothetical protein F2Q69_00053198 [Brassica cretica]KAF3593283.1 hypothetical protein DY000_02022215 [Brassica cretica]